MYDVFLKYVNRMIKIKNNHSDYPMKSKKYAVIMACHCDSTTKLEVIKNNLQYFDYLNVDTTIINTSELDLGSNLLELCSEYLNTKYYEMPNSYYYDFGKWIYALQNIINADEYDYIILTNDSFIIHNSINHFFNLAAIHNVELYGYNDSTQTRYHYQSYLFSLRSDVVKKFIENVTDNNLNITCQQDVIMNFEVKMTDWFFSKKCFLEIGKFKLNQLKNIFFINDLLYIPLKSSKLLPFTKLKRILQDHREVSFDSINSITITSKINKNIVNKDVNPNVKNMNMIYKNVNNINNTKNVNNNTKKIIFKNLMPINSKMTSKKLI